MLKRILNLIKFDNNTTAIISNLNKRSDHTLNASNIMMSQAANDDQLIQTKKQSESNQNESKEMTKSQKNRLNQREMKEQRKANLKIRRLLTKETKKVGFSGDSLNQTQYYFENGLRKVYPYFFQWQTTVKERWFNRTILDIYLNEFSRSAVNQSFEKLIETGQIRVNGVIKSKDYLIKNGDVISHAKHRHEIPVLADEIEIIHDDENFLVVNKPCSIPMHPCGKYRFNSLNIILTKEYGYKNLRTQYRLDRLTSGLVILGKNFKSSMIIDNHIKNRTAEKVYLSRVVGEFPQGRIVVDKGIDCASRKIGLYWLDHVNGKESITEFERISFNGKTSVVKCYPKTGRTHQIRIHLQYLGYPIINDPLYNQPTVWGKENGKDGVYEYTKEVIEKNFMNFHSYEAWIIKQEQQENTKNEEGQEEAEEKTNEKESKGNQVMTNEINSNSHSNGETNEQKESLKRKVDETIGQSVDDSQKESDEETTKKIRSDFEDSHATKNNRPGFDRSLLTVDDNCFECKQIYRDPKRSDLIMYLHAYSYKCGDLEFKTEMPYWAKDDFAE